MRRMSLNCSKASFTSYRPDSLLTDTHRIASAYGWSEAEILALPRTRRRRYADLIAQERGR